MKLKICLTEVPLASLGRPIIWSPVHPTNWVSQTSRGCPQLELLNICSSCKKLEQICNIASKKQIFIKLSIFLLVPCRSQTLEPLENLQGTSPGGRVPAGYKVFYRKLISNRNEKKQRYLLINLSIQDFQSQN